jgi:hypothetical protein
MDEREKQEGQAELDHAFDDLQAHAPDRVSRAIRWLRDPKGRWVRLPLGIAIIAANLLGPVVPFLGIEFVPIGLLLIAQDVPPLKKPVARGTLWLEHKWLAWRERRRQRKQA